MMSPGDLILCSVFALTLPAGQLMFKWAALGRDSDRPAVGLAMLANPRLILAGVWYGFTALFWFYVLTRVAFTRAYPFAIAGSALVPVLARLVFKEPLTRAMIGGYVLVFAGLALVVWGRV
jgi:drug/metabolite transporter (DMT)-like permease